MTISIMIGVLEAIKVGRVDKGRGDVVRGGRGGQRELLRANKRYNITVYNTEGGRVTADANIIDTKTL